MNKSYTVIFLITFYSFLMSTAVLSQESEIPDSFSLVYVQNFDHPQDIFDFEMTDPTAWRIDKQNENNALELFGASEYRSRVRSPFNIALLKDIMLGDFILEASLAQSGREYGHRDLCLFFGFQDPTNFYYVHIASVADNNANNVFIVNDEPRKNIASSTTTGTDWGATNSWHKVRVERKINEGSIKIYFDDMTKPIMEATDLHFLSGRVGFGSFDDTGRFDNIKIWAPQAQRKRLDMFLNANQKQ